MSGMSGKMHGLKMGVSSAVLAALLLGTFAEAQAQRATKRASAPAAAAETPAAQGVVNVNTATPEQLQLLPGIGPSKAEAIVEARRRQPFASVDQIVRVRGIGRATLRRLRPYLSVRGETTLSQPVRAPRAPAEAADPDPVRPAR